MFYVLIGHTLESLHTALPLLDLPDNSHYPLVATMPQTANATADDASGPVKPFPEPISISKPPGYFSRRRLLGPVDKDRGDLALLAHSLVTGMVDAATFANWSVFVGMQTGRLNGLF